MLNSFHDYRAVISYYFERLENCRPS